MLPAKRARHVREVVVVVADGFARRVCDAGVAETARVFGPASPTPVAVGPGCANRRAGRSLAAAFDEAVDPWTPAASRDHLHDRPDGIGSEKRALRAARERGTSICAADTTIDSVIALTRRGRFRARVSSPPIVTVIGSAWKPSASTCTS